MALWRIAQRVAQRAIGPPTKAPEIKAEAAGKETCSSARQQILGHFPTRPLPIRILLLLETPRELVGIPQIHQPAWRYPLNKLV
jgi:hypothetical protein